MYRAPSKRRQLIERVVVYSFMTIGVMILVTSLVFIMLGYRFNRDTSSIQQGGLVQFASRPIDASVTIGSAKLTDLTPSKITVNPGNYDVSMNREGYQDWTKNVDVAAGKVLWLNYAQLVPNDITTEALTRFSTVAGVKSSPNGDRFALISDPAKPVVTFVDVTGSTPKQSKVTLPDEILPQAKKPTYTLDKWANDSDHLLLTVRYDKTTERLLVDRRDADRAVNLSTSYQADIAEAVFDPRSPERIIVRSSKGDVRLIDTARDSLSSVLATKVTGLALYGNDAILVVQRLSKTEQSVGYVTFGASEVREIKRVSSSASTKVAVSKYFSDTYVAVSAGTQLDVYKASSLPSSESEATISMTNVQSSTLPAPADHLSIRTGGRFVVAQYGKGVETYDLELGKQTVTAFKAPVKEELRWLDNYHFYLTTGNELQVMEFDGANAHRIVDLSTTFDAVQSDDGKFIYSITASDSGYELQRSRMILEN